MGVTLAVGPEDQTYGGPLVIMFGAFVRDQCCRKQQAIAVCRRIATEADPKNSSKLSRWAAAASALVLLARNVDSIS
jgi:hypothetical protein